MLNFVRVWVWSNHRPNYYQVYGCNTRRSCYLFDLWLFQVSDENRIQTTEPVTTEVQPPKVPRFPTMFKLSILIQLSKNEINQLSLQFKLPDLKHILLGVVYLVLKKGQLLYLPYTQKVFISTSFRHIRQLRQLFLKVANFNLFSYML